MLALQRTRTQTKLPPGSDTDQSLFWALSSETVFTRTMKFEGYDDVVVPDDAMQIHPATGQILHSLYLCNNVTHFSIGRR